ncbi:HlyD family secretion protein [Lacihabitans sp. LS3-19]|uniref:HlyD family secretion protein n=1 Tax=Lacihabitans sp. LS3-19 TaxID=2487335 RepID=UPI0020CC5944|nr:HlyD family secretion protein [Lacihabitans sp. LS3-19]
MEPAKKKQINTKFLSVFIVVVVLGGMFGYYTWNKSQAHETTDDAQIEAKVSPIIPKISGYIKEVRVVDNQWVKKGDTLVILDDAEFALKVRMAEAAYRAGLSQLKVAGASVKSAGSVLPVTEASSMSAQANIATADANIESAKVALWRAKNDFDRYANLYKEKSVTKQQYEQAQAAKETAEKQVTVLTEQRNALQKQAKVAASQIGSTRSQIDVAKSQIEVADANISQSASGVENAKLYLSYTVIVAPEDGQISKVNLQTGQLVQAGQSLFMLVGVQNQWVVANFKETQMDKIRPGQIADIKVDAFPNQKLIGKIESISPATGSKFALLPPDNASGNYVKTIQRIPVKITLSDDNKEILKLIRPGMNVEVDVNIK